MKKQIAIIAFAATFSMAAGADSLSNSNKAGVGVQGQVQLKDLDTNSDGVISKQEAQANSQLSGKFDTLDKNRNGSLEQAEFARFESSPGQGNRGNSGTGAPSGSSDRNLDRNSGQGTDPGSPATRPGTGGMN